MGSTLVLRTPPALKKHLVHDASRLLLLPLLNLPSYHTLARAYNRRLSADR